MRMIFRRLAQDLTLAGAQVFKVNFNGSALHHGTPVKVCGSAIYDMPSLTFQGAGRFLAKFTPGQTGQPVVPAF